MTTNSPTWRTRFGFWMAAVRRRSPLADLVAETIGLYRRNRLGRMAALLAHYGFLAVFPLVVSFTTILGFVLQGNEALQKDIVDSALGSLPVIGQQLRADPGSLRGSGVILALSLLLAIWAGLRAFVVAQSAIDDIDGVVEASRLGHVGSRVRALATIAIVGLAQVLTAVSAALLSASPIAAGAQIALLAFTAVVNVALVAAAYRLLSSRHTTWRLIRTGAIVTGLGFAALQVVGSLVVGRAVARATPVYGTFATVIGTLTWLALHAALALIGYQLNAVLEQRAKHKPV